jgi:hypothetical protein
MTPRAGRGRWPSGARWALAAGALVAAALPALASAAPSTFGPVIGNAVLCRSHLDNAYFYAYLTSALGPSYKHEGGAYWFKSDATLWGANVTDILLSDDTSELIFIGAVTELAPDKLDEAIRAEVGTRHYALDNSTYPVRVSSPGSMIVHFDLRSKIYCAKFKSLPTGR